MVSIESHIYGTDGVLDLRSQTRKNVKRAKTPFLSTTGSKWPYEFIMVCYVPFCGLEATK